MFMTAFAVGSSGITRLNYDYNLSHGNIVHPAPIRTHRDLIHDDANMNCHDCAKLKLCSASARYQHSALGAASTTVTPYIIIGSSSYISI